jgi:hypothetical protein
MRFDPSGGAPLFRTACVNQRVLIQASRSRVCAMMAYLWSVPSGRRTGKPSSLSHRWTVRTALPKYPAISFQHVSVFEEADAGLEPIVIGIPLKYPYFQFSDYTGLQVFSIGRRVKNLSPPGRVDGLGQERKTAGSEPTGKCICRLILREFQKPGPLGGQRAKGGARNRPASRGTNRRTAESGFGAAL